MQPEWAATVNWDFCVPKILNISIHAARVGCDQSVILPPDCFTAFQSTQPEWAATGSNGLIKKPSEFQSTQPEWAATLAP